jgi:hypothetical protein
MGSFELVEELPRGPCLSLVCILQALANTLLCVGASGDVEQSLMGLSVLYNGPRISLNRKHY